MKTIVVKDNYGLQNVAIDEILQPQIKPNEVLVKVEAVSLNQLDLMIAKGAFNTPLPHTLGSDAAGVVEKTGTGVTQFKPGDTVATHFIQGWQSGNLKHMDLQTRLGTNVQGVFSKYIALPETSFVKIPSNLSVEEACTLPIAALTAWEAIVNAGVLKPGQTVLLQGTGGVSIFALQFAKATGAKVIITSGSDAKLAKAKAMGADIVVNYKTNKDWQNSVLELTNGKGVDLALEMSWADLNRTIESVAFGGKIIVIGLLGSSTVNLSVFGIMQKSISITGIQIGSRASYEDMNQAIEVNNIKPVTDRVFKLQEMREAFEYLESGKHFGKVVVKF